MTGEQALAISRSIREAVTGTGARYCSGSYGNVHDEDGAPFRFKMNFMMGGEKFNIELTGNDFDPGPFDEAAK